MSIIYVIAGNVREYNDYLRLRGIHPEAARYVVDLHVLTRHFCEGDRIAFTGTYASRPDYAELRQVVDGRRMAAA